MEKKKTVLLIVIVLLFLAILLVATFAYQKLTENNAPKDSMQVFASGQDDSVSMENHASQDAANSQQDSTQAESGTGEEPLTLAPDFTMQDMAGNAVSFSDYTGVPIVLNFWASWCPPCKAEMPDFEKVYKEYDPNELRFLMVNLVGASGETVEKGTAFIEESGYTFPVFFDINMEASAWYGISAIPTTFFIDADGYLVAQGQGAISEEVLRMGIDMIINEEGS